MSTTIHYQLSMFGKYNIAPTPETITNLMSRINTDANRVFVPNIINAQQIEIPTNRITSISNLAFFTQNQQYSITILNERIDINYNKIDSLDEVEFNEFYSFALTILSEIADYSGVKSNRLAMNVQQVCELNSFEQQRDKGKKYVKCVDYYHNKDLAEWSMRTNSQVKIDISNVEEKLNVITEISSAQDISGQKAAVIFHIDINTIPQRNDIRFDKDSLVSFVEKTGPIAKEIIEDVEELIANE